MDGLNRLDVAEHAGVLMVVVESEFLPPDPAVIVIPLLQDYPAVRHLNPAIEHDGKSFVLATRLIAAVLRGRVRRVGSVAPQGDTITRAIDVLMSGV